LQQSVYFSLHSPLAVCHKLFVVHFHGDEHPCRSMRYLFDRPKGPGAKMFADLIVPNLSVIEPRVVRLIEFLLHVLNILHHFHEAVILIRRDRQFVGLRWRSLLSGRLSSQFKLRT
jgi:hypothetical protein